MKEKEEEGWRRGKGMEVSVEHILQLFKTCM